MLTLQYITEVNIARCNRWHKGGLNDWTPADWMTALVGEIGEAANALKKLKRLEDDIQNHNSEEGRTIDTRAIAIDKIGKELADSFLYLNLLACRLGINLEDKIIEVFNKKSEEYNFPEHL